MAVQQTARETSRRKCRWITFQKDLIYMYACACVCSTLRGHKRALGPPGKLKVIVSCLVWLLGRAVSTQPLSCYLSSHKR